MPYSEILRRVALVETDVSEECIVSIIRVTVVGELGTTLAVTTNRNKSDLTRAKQSNIPEDGIFRGHTFFHDMRQFHYTTQC
jgi:hypothetical protein